MMAESHPPRTRLKSGCPARCGPDLVVVDAPRADVAARLRQIGEPVLVVRHSSRIRRLKLRRTRSRGTARRARPRRRRTRETVRRRARLCLGLDGTLEPLANARDGSTDGLRGGADMRRVRVASDLHRSVGRWATEQSDGLFDRDELRLNVRRDSVRFRHGASNVV